MSFPSFVDVAGCNITLTVNVTKQYFATEGFPHNYLNDQDCSFNFETTAGSTIVVFFEHFDLEEYYDFLHFRKLWTHTNTDQVNHSFKPIPVGSE